MYSSWGFASQCLPDSLLCYLCLCAGKILDMSVSPDGLLLCTTSEDKALKVFDVVNFGKFFSSTPNVWSTLGNRVLTHPVGLLHSYQMLPPPLNINFGYVLLCKDCLHPASIFWPLILYPIPWPLDMINMFRLEYVPSCCVWLYAGGAATPAVAWWADYTHVWCHAHSCCLPHPLLAARASVQWFMCLIVVVRTRRWLFWTDSTLQRLSSWRWAFSTRSTVIATYPYHIPST